MSCWKQSRVEIYKLLKLGSKRFSAFVNICHIIKRKVYISNGVTSQVLLTDETLKTEDVICSLARVVAHLRRVVINACVQS
jgi:hypothetical protein